MAGYKYKYPDYSYRYRLTVNIEVDGKIHSGSSVIEVKWLGGPELGDVGAYSPTLRGQAALVDLGQKGVVVASLLSNDWGRPARFGDPWGALWIAPRAYGLGTSVGDLKDWSPASGRRQLESDNMPLLLWLSDPQDPKTAEKIAPEDIPAIFGPSARFAGASVEITSDPIVIDINRKLPWFQSWSDHYRDRGPMYLQNNLALSRYMFVGDAS
ncbi:hypothetical protein [Bradyrhizobium sp. AZCC 2289]|uniref:hypothetical protein n=1 Tax=Bradyrhizobium sp. AZCC 2289 TaxID=3117026 RepID=UPI002FF2484D